MPLALLMLLSLAAPEEEPLPASAVHWRGALEATALALPSAGPGGALDGYLGVHPMAGVAVGDDFSLQLGAALRLRVLDGAPGDSGRVLRAADWDEVSDFGQLLEDLSLGREAGSAFLRAGPVRAKTLGFGHLVTRYANQDNPDYHPAGATGVVAAGPVRGELFASDVLGARLFAGELAWDLGRTFSADPEAQDRYQVALEVAHDAARAGFPTRQDASLARAHPPPVTLAHLDASVVLVRLPAFRLLALAGVGARLDEGAPPGALLGLAADARVLGLGLSLQLEGRKQGGGFRQGFFGPTYELSRFADVGFSGPPRASEQLPDGASLYAQLRVGAGTALSLAASGEYFLFGRADLDASAEVELLRSWLVAQARFSLVGLGVVPRTAVSASLRLRVAPSVYLVASGGTVFVPQLDGTLVRGVTASLGVGLDLER
jgi:hypothetical protein